MNNRKALMLLLVVYVLFTTLRLTAPYDIDSHDQAKQGLYVLDVVQNGHLFLPMEHGDKPATKPPLYNWAAAGVSLVRGDVTDLTIRLPSVVCGFGVVVITFLIGEMLFTGTAGLFAGLVLILNYHFINVSCLARTDMMLCLFTTLALYFFLLAYRQGGKKSAYNLFAFVAMGFASITKGPIGLLVPLAVILTFLFFKKDLQHLKSMQLGRGFAVWLAIMLAWFIPAWIEGGRTFFDIVVRDEMINRFFGVGTRAAKTRPFYYLVGHFFGKFLPWSLFIPSALVRFWKSAKSEGKGQLLFPVAWFLAVLVFFSLSRGKRSDYIVPLYPAASMIVAHFWVSIVEQQGGARWKNHVQILSFSYLSVCILMVAGLATLLAAPVLTEAIVRVAPESSQDIRLLRRSVAEHIGAFLTFAIPLTIVSAIGLMLGGTTKLRALLIAVLMAAGLSVSLYFHVMSPKAKALDGKRTRAFCAQAHRAVSSNETLAFCGVPNSIPFYMGRNTRNLTRDEVEECFRAVENPYVITTETDCRAMSEHPDFEFVVIEQSERLVKRNRGRFVLLGKRKTVSDAVETGH